MEFGRCFLSPSYQRNPDFKTGDPTSSFKFKCSRCNNNVEVGFDSLIGQGYSWQNHFDAEQINKIKALFDMNIVGKSPDGGSPAITEISCSTCSAKYLVYAGVTEIYNSLFSVTLQGITEILTYE